MGLYIPSLLAGTFSVVEEFLIKVKTIHRLLFSTNTLLAPIDVIDIYGCEGICQTRNSQARSRNKLYFHFNEVLATVNITEVMLLTILQKPENSFSMAIHIILFHNTLMLSQLFRVFAINPSSIKNSQHVNELLNFGTMVA